MPRCKNCKEKFIAKKFLQKYCMEKDECIKVFLTDVKAKIWKEEKAVLKDKLKTLSEHKKDLQTLINTLIREIDKGWPCIATNTMQGKRNAGHYRSVGSNETLRFHLENIWIQSEHSNSWLSGDTIRYQEGLIKTFGQKYFDYVHTLSKLEPIKLNVSEIESKCKIVRHLIKDIKLQDRVLSVSERIEYRKKYNKIIGIYK